MSSRYNNYSFIFTIFFNSLFFTLVMCIPLYDSPYEKFIDFLKSHNCTMPKEVKLPFEQPPEPSAFSYLSTPLKECQTSDALKEYNEAYMLCKEVFDVLQNITCFENNESLPPIETHLSENVCSDFKAIKNILPQQKDYLSTRLTDELICKVLCTTDKYDLLCKTLLWSYDTLTKIKNSQKISQAAQENENGSANKILYSKAPSTIKVSLVENELGSKFEGNAISNKIEHTDTLHPEAEKILGSDLNKAELDSHNASSSVDATTSQSVSNITDSPVPKTQNETFNNTVSTLKVEVTDVSKTDISKTTNQDLHLDISNRKNTRLTESNSLSTLNHHNEDINAEKNEINVDEQTQKAKIVDDVVQVKSDINSLGSNTNGLKSNQNSKSTPENVEQKNVINKDVNSDVDTKMAEKSKESITLPKETDNELNNFNLQEEENDSNIKQTEQNMQSGEIKNPKLTDFESPNEVASDIDLKLVESSTMQILPDENPDEHQEDQDQYNDTENEGDYPKAEYENSLNLPSKMREPDVVKNSNIAISNQMPNNYDNYSPKHTNRMLDDGAMGSPFPQQEDNHFFFYFLSIVLIIMAGYLIFHNKQKIIALIVEGRHERRRRSHGGGYKKLETK